MTLPDRPMACSMDSPQFIKDVIDRRNQEWMRAHGLNFLPKTWNADSRDGMIKGGESNCVLIALSDAGALNTHFWLEIVADAKGCTLKEFALKHPKGSFLVSYQFPERPDMYPFAYGGQGHYSAMVDGVLYNAADSAPDSQVNYAFEVLHEQDYAARRIDAPPIVLQDGTDLSAVTVLSV